VYVRSANAESSMTVVVALSSMLAAASDTTFLYLEVSAAVEIPSLLLQGAAERKQSQPEAESSTPYSNARRSLTISII